MAGTGLTDAGKNRVLANLVSGTTYLGLATALPDTGASPTLANITEVTTAGYAREAVTWGAPVFPGSPVNVSNSAAVSFGPMTADMVVGANYAFLCDVASGTTLSAPASLTVGTTGSSGVWGASTGVKYWVVTATNAQGETIASNEVSANVASASTSIPLAWTGVSGATGYRVYRGTAAGGENVLAGVVSSPSFTDTGANSTSATPPLFNSAPVGNVWYVWDLSTPAQVPTGKPVLVPANSLVIQ